MRATNRTKARRAYGRRARKPFSFFLASPRQTRTARTAGHGTPEHVRRVRHPPCARVRAPSLLRARRRGVLRARLAPAAPVVQLSLGRRSARAGFAPTGGGETAPGSPEPISVPFRATATFHPACRRWIRRPRPARRLRGGHHARARPVPARGPAWPRLRPGRGVPVRPRCCPAEALRRRVPGGVGRGRAQRVHARGQTRETMFHLSRGGSSSCAPRCSPSPTSGTSARRSRRSASRRTAGGTPFFRVSPRCPRRVRFRGRTRARSDRGVQPGRRASFAGPRVWRAHRRAEGATAGRSGRSRRPPRRVRRRRRAALGPPREAASRRAGERGRGGAAPRHASAASGKR